MTPERARRSRLAEVRREARAWEKSRFIDSPTRLAIENAYPLDGHEHAKAWRVVIFVIASVAIIAAFAAYAIVVDNPRSGGCLVFGALLFAATEALDRSGSRDNGAAGATSFWAVVFLSSGFALLVEKGGMSNSRVMLQVGMLVATIAFAVACWRWGIEAYGALGAAAFFLFLAQFPGTRAVWIVAALLLLPGTFRLLDRAAFAPEHRAAMAGVFATGAVALYAAINRFSVDRRLFDYLWIDPVEPFQQSSAGAQAAANVATAIVPLVFLIWGIRSRRRLILDLGVLFAALSLVTLRYYVHIAPLWVVLSASGAALLLVTLGMHRKLRKSPDGEWGGFTAHPLYSGDPGSFSAAAAIAGFAPEARLPQTPDPSGFTGGGGRSGGGGAAGSF